MTMLSADDIVLAVDEEDADETDLVDGCGDDPAEARKPRLDWSRVPKAGRANERARARFDDEEGVLVAAATATAKAGAAHAVLIFKWKAAVIVMTAKETILA